MKHDHQALILPYLIIEPGYQGVILSEIENAIMLCLSEFKRKKQTLLKAVSERVISISKMYYNLSIYPWRKRFLVVDSLEISTLKAVHHKIPNVLEFTESLKATSNQFAKYWLMLNAHSDTFNKNTDLRKVILGPVIADHVILEALSNLIEQHCKQAEMIKEIALISSIHEHALSFENVRRIAQRYILEWQNLRNEEDSMQYAKQVLLEETEHHIEKMSIETQELWNKYDKRISEMRRLVKKTANKLIKEREKEINKKKKLDDQKKSKLLARKKILKEKLKKYKMSLKDAQKKRKTQKYKYPKRSTLRWDNKIETNKIRIASVISEIEKNQKIQEEATRILKNMFNIIEERYAKLIQREISKVEILEESRKLEILKQQELLKQVKQTTSEIESNLQVLLTNKINEIIKLENGTLTIKKDKIAYIGCPLYLVVYKSTQKEFRIELFPPIKMVNLDGIAAKIRRRILSFSLEGRIQSILNPMSSVLNKFIFDILSERIETDESIRKHILEKAMRINLINNPFFIRKAAKGILFFEKLGFIKVKEKEQILEKYGI